MYKKFFILFFSFFIGSALSACDICGCGVGSSYIGILPDFSKNLAGLRYRYNTLKNHVGVNGSVSHLTKSETYQTAEMWSAFSFGNNFRMMLTVPIGFNKSSGQGVEKAKSGVGDIQVAGFYQLLNKRSMLVKEKMLFQSIWIGAAVKMPTGKYNTLDKQNTSSAANLFQLGTGSTDVSANLLYDIRLQDNGVNFSSSLKMNTTNRDGYRYGNRLSSSLQVYHKFKIPKLGTIAPNLGGLFESTSRDKDGIFEVDASGGELLMGTVGIECSFKKVVMGANFQLPLYQQIAKKIVDAGTRSMVHIAYVW